MTVQFQNHEAIFQDIVRLVAKAVEAEGDAFLQTLHKITGVQHQTLQQLAAMGHPYSAADPRPPQDPGIVNKQSGAFDAAFSRSPAHLVGDLLLTDIMNSDWKADMLADGTEKMIERNFMELAKSRHQSQLGARVALALKRYYKVRMLDAAA